MFFPFFPLVFTTSDRTGGVDRGAGEKAFSSLNHNGVNPYKSQSVIGIIHFTFELSNRFKNLLSMNSDAAVSMFTALLIRIH